VFGIADAFESPAIAALLPAVAPAGQVQRATAAATGVFQVAMIAGPALGGLAAALSPGVPYILMATCSALAAVLSMAIPRAPALPEEIAPDRQSVFAGIAFVRQHPAILGTISLDLFAVLLGGATALLPIYARDILHTGAWGLGVLRSAPAIGAVLMSALLARHAIARRAGLKMFQAVIIFGLATIVFALSRSLWLSLIALVVLGAADTVSMVIRIALVQLATPDAMRGRVGAVNYLFVNASNQLGQFESGLTAALLGAMPAALLGGVGTVLVALLWMKLFPALRTLERLE
jgi:MFS family permease